MTHEYLPARLVKGHRWYIVYYIMNPVTREWTRERKTFRLNRIKKIKDRQAMADAVIFDLNQKLPSGYPWTEIDPFLELKQTSLLDALQIVTDIKCRSDREATQTFYRSHFRVFSRFVNSKKLEKLTIASFGEHHARAYLDYGLVERGVSNATYNINLQAMKALFNELKTRKYVVDNPFNQVKKRKATIKRREPFSTVELGIISQRIRETDLWLYLSVNLLFYCFIRNAEQRRLRFRHFDIDRGLIRLPGDISKNKKDLTVTIPDAMLPLLEQLKIKNYTLSWFVFGKGFAPHPSTSCSRNTHNYKMKSVLKKLLSQGLLKDIEGKSFYSLKDTGAQALIQEKVNIIDIKEQLRHSSLETTQVYLQKFDSARKEIRDQEDKL